MANHFTNKVRDGAEFREFVIECAGAFDPAQAYDAAKSIEQIQKVGVFYPSEIEKAKQHLAWLKSLTPNECKKQAKKYNKENADTEKSALAEGRENKRKYEAMLKRAKSWKPPTERHFELKEFMITKLKRSIEEDCDTDPNDKIFRAVYHKVEVTGEQWLKTQVDEATDRISRFTVELEKEIKRVDNRNRWVKELLDSLENMSSVEKRFSSIK